MNNSDYYNKLKKIKKLKKKKSIELFGVMR
jgi:hypothetical protein